MKKKFGIKVISNSCGVLPHTLRVWEQRYNVFQPERTKTGLRLYSQDDLVKAKLLVGLIDQGHSISSLASYSIAELKSMISSFSVQTIIPALNSLVSYKNLLKYLSNYNIDMLATELQHLRLNVGAKEFIFEIILPVMREIGLLVAKGKITVTQEHIISTIVRDQLAQIYLPNIGPHHTEVAFATPEGNLHELPIIIADILCRANRVSTRYLGAAHPAQCLGQALNVLKCPYLVLGVLTSDQWNYRKSIITYLKIVDSFLDRDLIVILGGGVPLKFPKFKYICEVKVMESIEEFDKFFRDK